MDTMHDPTRTPIELLLVPTREPGRWRARVAASAPDGTARTLTLDLASVSPERAASEAISAWISTHAPSEPTDLQAPEPLPPAVLAFLEGRELGGVA